VNPPTNPKKRRVPLPKELKEMVDIIDLNKTAATKGLMSGSLALFLSLMLKSRERHATELVIEPELDTEADSSVTERIEGTWQHVMGVPATFREPLVERLVQLAAFQDEFAGVGLMALRHKGKRLLWRIDMEAPGSRCVLTPLPEG
jgi:hypothetical protein